MISKEDFAKFVFALKRAVPTFAPNFDDPATMDGWHNAFLDHSLDELRRVFVFVRANEANFPSIARLRSLLSQGSGSRFDELISLISKHGGYNPPPVEDVMARTINRLGGWQRICEWSNDELPYRRKEFDEVYKELSEQRKLGVLDQSKPALIQGIHQAAESYLVKSSASLALPPPVKEPEATEKQRIEAHWDRLHQRWGDELDLNISPHLMAKRFFKLKKDPEHYYRYPPGQDPVSDSAWPYKFVDVDKHRESARARQSKFQSQSDPTQFDASRYSVDNFKD